VVPDRCVLTIDRRTIPGETSPEAILAPFERLAADIAAEHPDADLRCRVDEWTEAAETPPDARIAELCRRAVADETGSVPADVGFTGITDARFYLNDAEIPTVILGPGSLTVAHTANESVAVEELVAAARIYARAFIRFLGA
jgi:acetylornithine deacetylase/succinyl-diaminopimelate desuccinylase-like protein